MTTNEPEQSGSAEQKQSTTRGGFLRSLGVLAGAAMVGQLAAAETADAVDNGNMLIGVANTSAHQTSVSMTPGTPDTLARSAIMGQANAAGHYGVTGQGVGTPTNGGTGNAVGVWGDARTGLTNLAVFPPTGRWGVLGTSDVVGVVGVSQSNTGTGGIGVNGYSNEPNNGTGVWGQADGVNGTGVLAQATLASGGVGLVANGSENGAWFESAHAAIWIIPRATAGPATDASVKGELLIDVNGVMWLCVADGTPGTWIQASHGGSRLLPAPQRAYDSRTSGAGKLRPGFGDTNAPRVIPIATAGIGVPANAVGIFGNITVTGASQGSFASIWPGGAWPGTSSINFQANTDLANAFTVGLGAGGNVSVATFAPTQVDVIVDVAGYIL